MREPNHQRDDSDPNQPMRVPAADGAPPIQLFSLPVGMEARFGLRLSGVDAAAPHENTNRSGTSGHGPTLFAWPPILAQGEGVDLLYRIERGRLEILLRGRARGIDAAHATETARRLWYNLRLVLESARAYYGFSPVDNPESLVDQALKYKLSIEPVGYRILSSGVGTIGFTPPIADTGRSLLVDFPTAVRPGPFNTVVHAASVCRSRAEIRIALDHVQLDSVQQALVGIAAERLHGASLITHADEGRRPVQARGVIRALETHLTRWQRNPSGLRLSASFGADQPPPATLLTLVGSELFHGLDITWRDPTRHGAARARSGPGDPPEGPFAVDTHGTCDLRGCVPAGTSLWPPLPSVHALHEAGVPTLFPDRVDVLPESGIVLGRVGQGARARTLRFCAPDRGRHCYLLGATGTGKSTLLFNMVMQDINAGAGVCLIDPHADLTEQVLDALPPERLDDLILFDPSDPERAAGLNFLETDGEHRARQMNFVTNEMIRIFGRLYDLRLAGGPVFEQYMRNALLLLMDNEVEGATLVDLPLLFESAAYRKHLLRHCRSSHVVSFWEGQAERAGGEASLSNMGPYITSKLNQFTHNAVLRPIIGQARSTINFRACMDRRKILLVKLSKGQLGTLDTQLLGMLVIGKLFDAALRRGNAQIGERPPFYLYVDEAQNFVTDSVTELLSEARKFGLHLTLANQTLAQMSGTTDLVSSLLGNVGTLLLFRLGILDAEALANFMRPELGAHHLQDLPNFHAAARLLVDGRPSRAFVFRTREPMRTPTLGSARTAHRRRIAQLRCGYTREISEVEAEMRSRRQRPKVPDLTELLDLDEDSEQLDF